MSTNTRFEFIQWLNKYRISSNNNRPSMTSINRLPRIIACTWTDVPPKNLSLDPDPEGGGTSVHRVSNNHPPLTDIFKWIQFNPLKCNVIRQHNWPVTIQTVKSNQRTKLGTLKFLMFSLFEAITFFFIYLGNKTKYLGHDFQWAIFEIITFLE